MTTPQLRDVFTHALHFEPASDCPSIMTVAHSGNWKALYSALLRRFPAVELNYGARFPVVFGDGIAFYLKQSGPEGALQFKASARRIVRRNSRLIIFDAQSVECLRSNPSCMLDVVQAGQTATLFFREGVPWEISAFLTEKADTVDWHTKTVCPTSVSVVAMKLAAGIIGDEYERVADIVTADERDTMETMRKELSDAIAPEVEDLFLEGSFGAEKLRAFARRKISIAVLKATSPTFSRRSGCDPVAFFRQELREKFVRHDLPVAYVNDVSPNLSFVVKTQKRFSELRLG